MKIIAITQARFGSTRFPGKVLKQLNGKSILSIHLERALKAKKISKLIVATTTEAEAKDIANVALEMDCDVYYGSVDNVLDRYYQAAIIENPDMVVRITSDCPLIDPEVIDKVVEKCIEGNYDYCSNTLERTFPDGVDVEVMKFTALEKAWKEAESPFDKEHVTPYIWKNSNLEGKGLFNSYSYTYFSDFSNYRLTVDYEADFELIKKLVNKIGSDKSWEDYIKIISGDKTLFGNT